MQPQIQTAIRSQSIAALMFAQLRPKQWSKNTLIFAALLFSFERMNLSTVTAVLAGFFLLCFVSGCVYILNDFVDREADRNHPVKRFRPMASGRLNAKAGLAFGLLLLTVSLIAAFCLKPLFGLLLSGYFLLNVLYSFVLKHIVIVDIMVIAACFVLRAIAGGLVIDAPLTPWFLICTMLLSLFLAIGKRRHELQLTGDGANAHRKVLDNYSTALLDQMIGIVTAATIISYCLFTFTSGRTVHLMWTIPFVVYGIFRYLYLIHMKGKGGAPDRVLFEDKPILVTVVLYVASVIVILAFLE
ncbi:decaprenyl-phosphate phosphoribosyltransferase [Paenibacillus nanensis]|uniref:Decaprenyl-phosphate phosphoribosyltransferase n=1 Tax=Paenibacillus nanensis TaxID=393251 RepID=A0A3A1UUI8_9BACL|nr:decaprenyl-phosphate phosphoribosyltransferase [Paenibacillus nanensis]RIX50842.1 decaprenyl-phosphate phosphoribosyltransferase [Paenibacillus nanensis]